MNFNSLSFLIFFPIVTVGFFILTMRVRSNTLSRLLLLAASLFFYACWNPAYLALMLISVAVTWTSGFLIEGQSASRKR
ncbi:MAG: MBOAT family protein, partial [Spirochaetaceae bacterium]|nr:MBOAT family protein [Spirochaetaceae bacterium]